MRRLRAGLVTPHSGGAGAPPGTITSPCQELADAMRTGAWRQSAARRRKENAADGAP
jgi:hypothetical protein